MTLRSRTYKTEAIVLRQIPLGEADRILTLFTPDIGKLRVVAKGVRRTKSRLVGHLELLNRVSVSLAHGRNLDIVNEAQIIQTFSAFSENLESLSRAIYLAELVNEFSAERSPDLTVYNLLVAALNFLAAGSTTDLLLRYFETHLLGLSGYRPELYKCVECQSTLEPEDHYFSHELGGVLCPTCRTQATSSLVPVTVNAMKVLRHMQRHDSFADVAHLSVSAQLAGEIERILRTYVRYVIDRDLKSAEFMNQVSAATRSVQRP